MPRRRSPCGLTRRSTVIFRGDGRRTRHRAEATARGPSRAALNRPAATGEGNGASMLKSLKLHGVGPVPDLSAFFGERLNILTGDNGLGKSFLLDTCFWTLTGTWPGGRTALPEP